jgi:crotonobetainyl-CoA:carnitine CoA-transferase CaiB-like acyl-CoA transferase
MDILQGIRVVDLTMFAFVPAVGGVMAHWGADVIKVENPMAPDPMRFQNGNAEPGNSGFLFKHYSRGKRSIAIDLSSDAGKEVLYKLCEDADVFLTSYLTETRQKLKVDVEHIRARNPSIIYVRGSGQGPKGPESGRGGYDAAAWWCRGTLAQSVMDVAGVDAPTNMVGHGDGMSGMAMVSGVCAALLKRERTGVPSVVDGSLMGTAIWFNGMAIISSKLPPIAPGAMVPQTATMGYYRTADNRYLFLTMLGNSDSDWRDLCEHLDRSDLADDPRFATPAARLENRPAGVDELSKIFGSRPLAEWKKILVTTKGVWAPVQSIDEVYTDPQTVANGFLRPQQYATGPLTVPIPPVLFDEEGGDPPPAPDFAAHTDEVLAEAGYTADEVARLRADKVVV